MPTSDEWRASFHTHTHTHTCAKAIKMSSFFLPSTVHTYTQGPASRFGDTAANAGVITLLDSFDETKDLPVLVKVCMCVQMFDNINLILSNHLANPLFIITQKQTAAASATAAGMYVCMYVCALSLSCMHQICPWTRPPSSPHHTSVFLVYHLCSMEDLFDAHRHLQDYPTGRGQERPQCSLCQIQNSRIYCLVLG